jgi:hypothetical protein
MKNDTCTQMWINVEIFTHAQYTNTSHRCSNSKTYTQNIHTFTETTTESPSSTKMRLTEVETQGTEARVHKDETHRGRDTRHRSMCTQTPMWRNKACRILTLKYVHTEKCADIMIGTQIIRNTWSISHAHWYTGTQTYRYIYTHIQYKEYHTHWDGYIQSDLQTQ